MSTDAAELRRQKILKNSQKRLELLMGIKNAEATLKENDLSESLKTESINENLNHNNNTEVTQNEPIEENLNKKVEHISHLNENKSNKITSLSDDNSETENIENIFTSDTDISRANLVENQVESICKFNGYSNKEVLIFFLIALATSLLFFLDQADYIYMNVLLPFFTFEIAHLIVHFNYLPATSSQFQLFRTLLQLCGISQKSLKKMMIVFNFLFILIDNFVIYILSFVVINLVLNNLI